MTYTYKFYPGSRRASPLRAASRADAESQLKTFLHLQSQVGGRSPPDAIALIEDGLEVWRWTQDDRWAA